MAFEKLAFGGGSVWLIGVRFSATTPAIRFEDGSLRRYEVKNLVCGAQLLDKISHTYICCHKKHDPILWLVPGSSIWCFMLYGLHLAGDLARTTTFTVQSEMTQLIMEIPEENSKATNDADKCSVRELYHDMDEEGIIDATICGHTVKRHEDRLGLIFPETTLKEKRQIPCNKMKHTHIYMKRKPCCRVETRSDS